MGLRLGGGCGFVGYERQTEQWAKMEEGECADLGLGAPARIPDEDVDEGESELQNKHKKLNPRNTFTWSMVWPRK
jgi:hypothetical protein